MDERFVDVEDWTTNGIEDCLDCPEDLCETSDCDGPEDLPRALSLKDTSIYRVVHQNDGYDVSDDLDEACGPCRPARNVYLCCGEKGILRDAGLTFKDVVVVTDEGLFLESVCDNLGSDGNCGDYENRPSICREYHCKEPLNYLAVDQLSLGRSLQLTQ